jgi:hypothetical protein
LLITDISRKAKELLLRKEHFLAPAATKRGRARKWAIFAEIIVTLRAWTAGCLYARWSAIRAILEHHTIPNPNALCILAYFQNLANDLMAWIRTSMQGESRWRNTQISIPLNHMKVAAADPCQAVAYTHPGLLRKRLAW